MVELSTGTAIAIAAGGGAVFLLLLAALVRSSRRWRAASRRLAATATRLELPGDRPADERDVVGRIERQAQAVVLRLSDESARADRLAGALGHVGAGVVVCDEQGGVAYRNALAPDSDEAEAPAADAVRAVLRAAVDGRGEGPRTVELAGPPWRTVAVTGHALDDGRRVVGGVAVIDDVSEGRRLDVVRRDFLANVTAELQAPVAALGLLAGTIVAEDDPALTRRLAGRLEHDALRVSRLVDDLAELSRLDAQALAARGVVPVHLLAAQAVEEACQAVPGRTVTVDASAAPSGTVVVGDRRQLVSALRRMVENALRFSAGGSAVTVALTCGGGWVDVAVTDTGPGIPAGELDRVFECFYRAGRDDRARTAAGTGIGLAIASQVAAVHGGHVLAASTEGAGSTFTLRLPAAAGPARDRNGGPAAPAAGPAPGAVP